MNTIPRAGSPAPFAPGTAAAPDATATGPAPSPQRARIERVFREALRRQQVHPLMELVRRYRERELP